MGFAAFLPLEKLLRNEFINFLLVHRGVVDCSA
jgi:hypothetical protein